MSCCSAWAERNAREFTATGDTIAAATHTSPSTTWRCLARLEELCLLERTNNGAPPPPDGGRFCHRANSYRLLDVAETAARRLQAEPVIVTVALHCQNDNVVFPGESKIPSAGTGDSTAREAARAKWLPEPPGGQEGSLPTNTHPDQCVEILAPSAPICSEVAPVDPRLGGFGVLEFGWSPIQNPDCQAFRPIRWDIGRNATFQPVERRSERRKVGNEGDKMRWNHPVCDPCSQPLRATHVLIRGAPGSRALFCGWCATRTESGLTVRCDPAGVPYPDNPVDARLYVARFRHTALAGVATIAGPRGPDPAGSHVR